MNKLKVILILTLLLLLGSLLTEASSECKVEWKPLTVAGKDLYFYPTRPISLGEDPSSGQLQYFTLFETEASQSHFLGEYRGLTFTLDSYLPPMVIFTPETGIYSGVAIAPLLNGILIAYSEGIRLPPTVGAKENYTNVIKLVTGDKTGLHWNLPVEISNPRNRNLVTRIHPKLITFNGKTHLFYREIFYSPRRDEVLIQVVLDEDGRPENEIEAFSTDELIVDYDVLVNNGLIYVFVLTYSWEDHIAGHTYPEGKLNIILSADLGIWKKAEIDPRNLTGRWIKTAPGGVLVVGHNNFNPEVFKMNPKGALIFLGEATVEGRLDGLDFTLVEREVIVVLNETGANSEKTTKLVRTNQLGETKTIIIGPGGRGIGLIESIDNTLIIVATNDSGAPYMTSFSPSLCDW